LKARLEKPPVVGAMYITTDVRINNAHCLQQAVISFIIIVMGDIVTEIGTGRRPNLRKYAKEAADRYLPNGASSFKTAERWFLHYLQFGETPEETSKWSKSTTEGDIRRVWLTEDSHALKAIVDQNPGLFLDEIVDRMHEETGARWNPSTLWKKLRKNLGYSLQRVAEKALERDEKERMLYDAATERPTGTAGIHRRVSQGSQRVSPPSMVVSTRSFAATIDCI
jgi:transposase